MSDAPPRIPAALLARLPATVGTSRLVDVRIRNVWFNGLLIDGQGRVLGRRFQNRTEPLAAAWGGSDIDAVRPTSWADRLVASLPLDPYNAGFGLLLVTAPTLLMLGRHYPVCHVINAVLSGLILRLLYEYDPDGFVKSGMLQRLYLVAIVSLLAFMAQIAVKS